MITIGRGEIEAMPLLKRGEAAVRDAFVAVTDGRADLPPVGHLAFVKNNADCHIKYGYIDGDSIFVVKIAAGFYDNPKLGLPSSNGMMVAFSAKTGQTLAIIDDQGLLTDLRTGLGGAIATLALARKDAEVFGIVGSGTQARHQIRALASVYKRPLKFLVWGRNAERSRELATELTQAAFSVEAETDLKTLCERSDAIITTTPSERPLVMSEWVRPGTHITAMGADSPGKQELETELVARADRRVVDLGRQSLEHGEFAHARQRGLIGADDCVELGRVLSGAAEGRRSASEITIADLTGLATQDIAIARTALQLAGRLDG